MVAIEQEIAELYSHGINFDSDLYVALTMALTIRRSILVSSDQPGKSMDEVMLILRDIWCLADTEFKHIQLRTGLEDFSIIRTPILVLSNLEITDDNFQKQLLKYLSKKETILILVLPKNFKIFKRLQDYLMFQQYHTTTSLKHIKEKPQISRGSKLKQLEKYRLLLSDVKITNEIRSYIYDIVIFTRYNRFVVGGVPTFVLKDYELFLKCFAILNGYKFIIPQMVKLASYKILPLRIKFLVDPNDDPSVLYGSNPKLIKQLRDSIDVDYLIEIILNGVPPPI